jgi:hypothetical protein
MSGLLQALGAAVGSALVESEVGGKLINQAVSQTPQYQRYQKNVQEYAHQNEMIAMAGVATSITFGTLGVCFSLTGRNGIGSGLIIIAVPIGYFSYNSNAIYENMKNDFAENLFQHMAASKDQTKIKIDQKKLRACLLKRTFCYDLLIDFHVRSFITFMESQQKSKTKFK